MAVVGVDEAGRGPVLGSMFAAGVRVADPAALPDDLDDSKTLTPERRVELDDRLRGDDRISVSVVEIEPARIDDPASDMNSLTAASHAEALAGLVETDDRVILDACDVSAERFARRVTERLDEEVRIRAEHRADSTYAAVSAASVVAKVARDAHVETLAEEFGELGSGYPSDPTTRAFLAGYVGEHGGLPTCARASWQTSRDALAAAEQSALGEF